MWPGSISQQPLIAHRKLVFFVFFIKELPTEYSLRSSYIEQTALSVLVRNQSVPATMIVLF